MKKQVIKTILAWFFGITIFFSIYLGLGYVFVTVMNSDLYGRLIQTVVATGVGSPNLKSEDKVNVRLVLHKFLADENSVEASLILETNSMNLVKEIKEGKTTIIGVIRDGSSSQPYGISNQITLNKDTSKVEAGQGTVAVQSERFHLPALPSVWGYPYDDLEMRPIVDIRKNGVYSRDFRLEIQKAVPGRMIDVSDGDIAEITLSRSTSEKAFVLISSIIFLLLTIILAYGLISKGSLSTLEEIVAVASYLIATAGFRDLLGLSRIAGTSALEIAVIGIPLLILTLGVTWSFVRGLRKKEQESKPIDPSLITNSQTPSDNSDNKE